VYVQYRRGRLVSSRPAVWLTESSTRRDLRSSRDLGRTDLLRHSHALATTTTAPLPSLSQLPVYQSSISHGAHFSQKPSRCCSAHCYESSRSQHKSVFSFLRQLTTFHCSHLLLNAVLLCAVLLGARPPPLSSISPARPPGPQQQTLRNGVWQPNDGTVTIACPRIAWQQTRRTLLQRSIDGTDRRTDRQADRRTDAVSLHRPCRLLCASSVNN